MNQMSMIAISTLNLACKLHDDLIVPRELRLNGQPNAYVVKGGVQLKGPSAQCSILVTQTWVSYRPDVICHEPWLRKEADWHAFSDGSLCYVYAPEWRDVMRPLVEKDGFLAAAEAARLWITRNVAWLLNKHLLADELGITKWQKDWPFWPHDANEARRQYKGRR